MNKYYLPFYTENDDDCSCSSCECANCMNENDNMMISINKDSCLILYDIDKDGDLSKNYNYPLRNTSQDINEIIEQSYRKLPNRLKANIYKDLIRRETLLHHGKNHIDCLLFLLRCTCKISYEQSAELSKNSNIIQHAILYTMTAVDYLLQRHYPEKKPLFNYILNEYISMWLHENLRIIQEDFSILVEHGNIKNFLPFCTYLFDKFESLCETNWKRLQAMQNYRLIHFKQLMKMKSVELEVNQDFIQFYGKPIKSPMKRSEIPITLLYSNRTDNELITINEIHERFRKSIANILMEGNQIHSQNSLHR
ncbi:hypothetical protein I4U23_006291 [Adineta vaga]|nr:hypothetical protein I4U23_006291 [Adineta vaga]